MEVLESMPWESLFVDVFTLECDKGRQQCNDFLREKGYAILPASFDGDIVAVRACREGLELLDGA